MSTGPIASRDRNRLVAILATGGWSGGVAANVVLVVGAGLAVWTGIVHLHLWSTGYRNIPTIGPLFIMQGIVAIVLAVALAAVRRVWMALAVFLFVASTIGGFLLSVYVGLFGFQDSWSAPFATEAFALEVTALVVLAVGGALCLWRSPAVRTRRSSGPPTAPSPST